MHSPDDVQYAMETTRILLEPDRRIDTFGDTRFNFLILSELMDSTDQVRIRYGKVEAVKPRIIKPDGYSDVELVGFGDKAQERFDRMLEKLREAGHDLAFLNYGFRFKTGDVQEELLHETMDSVRDRILEEARLEGNPSQAIIEGVDDTWEISVIKFTLEMIGHSLPINQFDLQRRGLL